MAEGYILEGGGSCPTPTLVSNSIISSFCLQVSSHEALRPCIAPPTCLARLYMAPEIVRGEPYSYGAEAEHQVAQAGGGCCFCCFSFSDKSCVFWKTMPTYKSHISRGLLKQRDPFFVVLIKRIIVYWGPCLGPFFLETPIVFEHMQQNPHNNSC